MEDVRLTWNNPLTSEQAAKRWLTKGFVSAELYESTVKILEAAEQELTTLRAQAAQLEEIKKTYAEFQRVHGITLEDSDHTKPGTIGFVLAENKRLRAQSSAVDALVQAADILVPELQPICGAGRGMKIIRDFKGVLSALKAAKP